MSPFPYPQAYVDCELPVRPDGTRLERPRSSEESDYYINWLADYLYTTDIPIPDSQKDITADILSLAEEMTITPVLDDIEYYVELGEGFAGLHKMELDAWDVEDEDLKKEYIDEEGNNHFFTTEAQYNRVAAEIEKRKKNLPEGVHYADIPYRALIARQLKKIPRHEDRVAALERYFARIVENLGK